MSAAIAKRVKEIRAVLGSSWGKPLPRDVLAERLGVDTKTVYRWEAGRAIKPDNAVALAELAGCDVDWLLRGHGRPPQPGAGVPRLPQVERSAVPRGAGARRQENRTGAAPSAVPDAPARLEPHAPAELGRGHVLAEDEAQRLHDAARAVAKAVEVEIERRELYGADRQGLIAFLEELHDFLELNHHALGDLPDVILKLRREQEQVRRAQEQP